MQYEMHWETSPGFRGPDGITELLQHAVHPAIVLMGGAATGPQLVRPYFHPLVFGKPAGTYGFLVCRAPPGMVYTAWAETNDAMNAIATNETL